jgi:hypothetical protein
MKDVALRDHENFRAFDFLWNSIEEEAIPALNGLEVVQ